MRSIPLLAIIGALATLPLTAAEQPAPGKQAEQQLKAGDVKTVDYLLYLPKEYAGDDSGKAWPLMLFLHGRGESDGPLSIVKKWGPPRLIERGEHFPYIVVSPQCPRSPGSWPQPTQQAHLLQLLEHITKTYKVDKDRIYLTGLSMGGEAAYRFAAHRPETFAALAPLSCYVDSKTYSMLERIKDLPVWVIHGADDTVFPLDKARQPVEAIRAAGGDVLFTILEGHDHDTWTDTYSDPTFYEWLLEHLRP